jgi:general secretion pathway protein E
LVVVDDDLRQLIHDQASEQVMVDHVRGDAPTIQDDGRQKVLSGDTTIQEILRVTLED